MLVGIDLGGTQVRMAVATDEGTIIATSKASTPSLGGPEGFVEWVKAELNGLAAGARPTSVGVGAPGPLDPRRGVLVNPPNLDGWRPNLPLAELLEKALGAPVHVENDANVSAVAEHRRGLGVGVQDMVYVTWSTGIGAGLILGGRLLSGAHGTAGELGHMILAADGDICLCGQRGCLEQFACGNSLARRHGRPAVELFAAARLGDPAAAAVVREAATRFGTALVNLTNLIDPELIVVGGGVTRSWGIVRPVLEAQIRASPFIRPYRRPRLVRSRMGDMVGLVGAVEWARDHAG